MNYSLLVRLTEPSGMSAGELKDFAGALMSIQPSALFTNVFMLYFINSRHRQHGPCRLIGYNGRI